MIAGPTRRTAISACRKATAQAPAATVIALLLAVTGLAFTSAGAASTPCTSGLDVRNLSDSSVPQTLKDQIFKNPGPVISTASSIYPSGKVVVIRAASQDFPENTAVTAAYVDEIFFGSDPSKKSMRGYFARNSYGKFLVTKGAVPAWITLSKKLTDYSPGIEANAPYLKDVLKKANVSWTGLDANKDKTIGVAEAQIVVLVPNGPVFASTRSVSAGAVSTPQGSFTFAKRPIVIFSLKASSDPQKAVNPIRALAAVAHELSHAFFNLPDRYGKNTGTGEYDMMGSASSSKWVHLPMPDKLRIGWIKPKIVRGHVGKCLQFVASELQSAALILAPIDQFLSSPLEYWVIENRNAKFDSGGYDDDLPDKGLAIWYVSSGTHPNGQGFDDVRLVDFSKPDQDPDTYSNPGGNALFKSNASKPKRVILNRDGHWNLIWFQNVSDVAAGQSGLFMYAEF